MLCAVYNMHVTAVCSRSAMSVGRVLLVLLYTQRTHTAVAQLQPQRHSYACECSMCLCLAFCFLGRSGRSQASRMYKRRARAHCTSIAKRVHPQRIAATTNQEINRDSSNIVPHKLHTRRVAMRDAQSVQLSCLVMVYKFQCSR